MIYSDEFPSLIQSCSNVLLSFLYHTIHICVEYLIGVYDGWHETGLRLGARAQ